MTLKTNANRQSNVASSCSEQTVACSMRVCVPRLRRTSHAAGGFLADAILVPASGDVNLNLGTIADDFAWVTPDVDATAVVLRGGGDVLTEPGCLNEARLASALDEDDEDEDEDDAYDDDDLDEDDDEDLDEDDAEFDDDDLDDDDLDDDDLDDEDEEDEEE